MKKKVLISSILTIAMCLSIIAGSTFAIFTSESKVDVSVTAANVKVSATVLDETLATYSMGVLQAEHGSFENGGSAVFDSVTSTLTLNDVTPGDMANFKIQVTNSSDVTIQYRVKWSIGGKLAEVLTATVDGEKLVNGTSEWAKWLTSEENTKTIDVSVLLPLEIGNTYQNESASINFTVEAVQGNAIVSEVYSEEQLKMALTYGNTAKLMGDVTLTNSITIPDDEKAYVIDLNGNDIICENSAAIVNNGNLTVTSASVMAFARAAAISPAGTVKSNTTNAIINTGTMVINEGTYESAVTYAIKNSGDIVITDAVTKTGGIFNTGAMTLNNCTVENTVSGKHAVYHEGSKLTINGGSYTSTSNNEVLRSNSSNVTVNDGTFTCNVDSYIIGGNGITINGGNFIDTVSGSIRTTDNITINGGTFNFDPTAWIKDTTNFESNEDGESQTWSVDPKEGVTVIKTPEAFESALEASAAAGSGDTTVYMMSDIDLTGSTWTPINVDGYNGAGIVTVYGNGNTITGLSAPLFAGGFAGNSGIIIKDLTIADSNIVSTSGLGGGAFIDCADSMHVITVDNCHVANSTISGERVGGIIGWCSGYAKENDGPVKAYITINDCSVVDCEIIGAGSAGGIAGHPGASDYTWTTIEDCAVKNTSIHSNDDGGWRVGSIVGTANNGHIVINNVDVENVKLSQINKGERNGKDCLYGRFVPSGTGTLEIDGTKYVYTAEQVAEALTSADDNISIVLVNDITVPITSLGQITGGSGEYKLGGESTKSITVDLGGNKLTISTTYWSILGAKNADATMTFKNGSMTSSQTSGTWNSYDLCFTNCNIALEDIVFDKAIALESAGKTVTLKNVTVNESHDYYAIWITAEGQNVSMDNVTINSAGRAIKIADEYVDAPAKVTLSITNSKFVSVKKAAVLVASPVGAEITVNNFDISEVASDAVNVAWKDNGKTDWTSASVTVNGEECIVEP